MVIYDFKYTVPSNPKTMAITLHTTESEYFYLYRSDHSSETFRFIHQAHFEDQQRSDSVGPLFDEVILPPPGFIHNDLVYLFDIPQGCVYIFKYYPELQKQLKTVTSFLYPRKNVPFEDFFLCRGEWFDQAIRFGLKVEKLDAHRCDTDPSWTVCLSTFNSDHL